MKFSANQFCNKSMSKWADMSRSKFPESFKYETNVPAIFPQKRRLKHLPLSYIWIERKNIKNKTLCNIRNQTKTKAKTMCVGVCTSDFMSRFPQHTWEMPLKTPIPQNLHYPSLLVSPPHVVTVGGSSEKRRQRQHWSSLALQRQVV